MLINSFGLSSIGKKRTNNQDSFLINNENHLYIVSDGMGGFAGGEIASSISVNSINDYIVINSEVPPNQVLELAIKQASSAIYDRAQIDPNLNGMGTTTTVLFFKYNFAFFAQVGDSRAYFFRENCLWQLTDDHSLVNEQVKAGHLTKEDAKHSKFKNVITRSVGFHKNVEPDIYKIAIRENDRFLLCSDGLSNYFYDDELLDIMKNKSISDIAHYLIDEANARGGEDNITALVVDVEKTK